MTPGTQLNHYEILSAIGKGGMGEVWRAKDSKLGREHGRCRTSASMPGKPFLMGIEGGSCFVAGKSGIFKGFDGKWPGV